MTVNPDKYVDEIRELRRRHVRETEHMTPEERDEIIRKSSEEVQRIIAQMRAERLAAK